MAQPDSAQSASESVPPGLVLARAARRAGEFISPHLLYEACGGDVDLYRHAMREAGLIVDKASEEAEVVCSICGWSMLVEIVLDVEGALALLPDDVQEAYRDSQRSIIEARRAANANEGDRWIG